MKKDYYRTRPPSRPKAPKCEGRNSVARHQLKSEQLRKLLEIIQAQAADNPFPESVRIRNALIVGMMIDCGLRTSELLELRTSDIANANGAISAIARRERRITRFRF